MKKVLLGLTVSFTLTVAHGQTTFQKTYGGTGDEESDDIQQTNDGGFIITGAADSFFYAYPHIYLIKTSSNGSLQWTKTFERGGSDFGISIQQTNDDGFIITGQTYSTAPQQDVFLMKTYSDGNIQWAKTFGGGYGDWGQCIQQTSDGGFIISGSTSSFGAGDVDMYLLKTDSDGSLQWTKTFGGINEEQGYSVQQTHDGGFIITGNTFSFGAGSHDVYLVKTDSIGSLQWAKTFGGTFVDRGLSVEQTADSGFVVAGSTTSFGAGNSDLYIVKTASDGSLQWSKTYGGTSTDEGRSTQETNDGGFIISGSTRSFGGGNIDVYLIKTDSNGNSGCNETNTNTIVTAPATIVTSLTAQVSSGGISSNPYFQIDSVGIETTLCILIGTNEINHTHNLINISPNPFSTQTTLQTDNHFKNATLMVYNCFGQEVKQIKNIIGQSVTFNRGNLPSGVYFVRLAEENKTIAIEKLLIID